MFIYGLMILEGEVTMWPCLTTCDCLLTVTFGRSDCIQSSERQWMVSLHGWSLLGINR